MTDTVTYTRTYPTLGNSVITTKINNLYPQSLYEDANSIDITIVDNYATPPGGGGIGAQYVNHEVNNRTGGGESLHYGVSLNAELRSGFNIGFTQITQSKRLNGGYADSVWFNSWGPDSNFATKPDARGIVHSFNAGAVRVGEVNFGNAWGDFGFLADRTFPSRWVAGLEFFPDWLPGATGDNAARHYHASWAQCVGGAGPDAAGICPKNWIGWLLNVDGIVGAKDHAHMLPGAVTGNTVGGGGYAHQINGSSDPTNAIGKGINFRHAIDVAIDFSEAKLTTAAMTLADEQVIKLGGVYLRGSQGHLQYSKNGLTWINIF